MKKIPCLFEREFTDQRRPVLLASVTPGCEWAMAGRGIATRKWDGTAVLVRDGKIYARLDCKRGKQPPEGALPCQEPDPITGHWPHWVLADRPEDKWIRAAANVMASGLPNGTYEAIGPKIGGNAEHMDHHELKRHGDTVADPVRTLDGLREFLAANDWEGIVFHHPDGWMCKIRRADFGLPWPIKVNATKEKLSIVARTEAVKAVALRQFGSLVAAMNQIEQVIGRKFVERPPNLSTLTEKELELLEGWTQIAKAQENAQARPQ